MTVQAKLLYAAVSILVACVSAALAGLVLALLHAGGITIFSTVSGAFGVCLSLATAVYAAFFR